MDSRNITTVPNQVVNALLLIFLLAICCSPAVAGVRLPKLVGDGMVLQRDAEVNIWGWASPGEEITVRFLGETYQTVAGEDNRWSVRLAPMSAGGPYSMQIDGENHIALNDIMIGDVWICSGQSNMVLPMDRVKPLYEDVIDQSENDKIRYFQVPMAYDFSNQQEDLLEGSWESANPWSVLDFSATAYFFAQSLYEEDKVPIGLINASIGGTPISAWMSDEALSDFPSLRKKVDLFANPAYVDSIIQQDEAEARVWNQKVWANDQGLTGATPWYQQDYDDTSWSTMMLPAFWEDQGLEETNGVVWFRKSFTLSEPAAEKKAKLLMGRIIDADYVYVNGSLIGTTSYQYPPRRYEVAPEILQAGKNTIAVRVIGKRGNGGFFQDKPYKIITGQDSVDLSGEWRYKLGVSVEDSLPDPTFIQYQPMGLFNGMIAPLLPYTMKGVIWYQGESNVGTPSDYSQKFTTMINDWRDKWDQGIFPFLFAQLPNYGQPNQEPDAQSGWAKIREDQRKTLTLPQTGMAVTIDLGEWNDVHPLNKKDVGKRLALAAQSVAYGHEDIVSSGPLYESGRVKGQKIYLSFKQVGEGLKAKDGVSLEGFTIADKDKKFIKAQAKIIAPDTVMVWSQKITNSVWVRYAWADNPEDANLYNKKGLPASPFEAHVSK